MPKGVDPTIYEYALDRIPEGSLVGLGSGRASTAFVKALGARIQAGKLRIRGGVPTSEATGALARQLGIPLLTLAEAGVLDVAVDGADEVDPNLDMIKGYGRAMVREKIVEASSRRLVILAGADKKVPKLGTKGKLPVEVIPFGMALAQRRLRELAGEPVPYMQDGRLFVTDNGNHILDCKVGPIANPAALERAILDIPGVVGTGLFLGMANTVLIGDEKDDFRFLEEMQR
jgi:ribose 5-phosphate isomerase A